MAIPPINVDKGTHDEELFQNKPAYARLSSVCASVAAIPHADVGQFFKLYLAQFFPNNQEAMKDGEEVFRMLNDDGNGVNNAKNMAVGYKLHRLADIFKKISKLKDKIGAQEYLDVDQPERFNTRFYDAQFRFPERPEKDGNHALDFIRLLQYVDALVNNILLALKNPLMVNAEVVYSDETKPRYLELKTESEEVIKEIISILNAACKIIGKYQLSPELLKALNMGETLGEEQKVVLDERPLSTKERARLLNQTLQERIDRREGAN